MAQRGQALGGESGQAIVGQGEHLQGLKRKGELFETFERTRKNAQERQYLKLYLKKEVNILTCLDTAKSTQKERQNT